MEPKSTTTNLAAAPKQQSEIGRLFDELSMAISAANDNLDTTRAKLSPVLRNEPGQDSGTPSLASNTDMGTLLVTLIERAHTINTKVMDINNRLEV